MFKQYHHNWSDYQAKENEYYIAQGYKNEQLPFVVGDLPKKFTLSNAAFYVRTVFNPAISDAKIKKTIKERGEEVGKLSFSTNYYNPGASATTGNISQTKKAAAFYSRDSVEALFE